MLHGSGDSWRSWELLLPELPSSLHAFTVTQHGHGNADRPAAGYRPKDHAADVAAFMDAVGLDAAVVAGHSGGSHSAQRFALDHPERTLGLVLIGAFRASHDNPDVLELGEAISEPTDPVDPEFVRGSKKAPSPNRSRRASSKTIVAESRKLPARVWKTYLRDILDADVPTETATIDAPTLILWGDHDAFCPRSTRTRSWPRSLRRALPPRSPWTSSRRPPGQPPRACIGLEMRCQFRPRCARGSFEAGVGARAGNARSEPVHRGPVPDDTIAATRRASGDVRVALCR